MSYYIPFKGHYIFCRTVWKRGKTDISDFIKYTLEFLITLFCQTVGEGCFYLGVIVLN